MRERNRWHPCFLPEDYVRRVKQAHAEILGGETRTQTTRSVALSEVEGSSGRLQDERREANGERRPTACTVDAAVPVDSDADFCQVSYTDSDQVVEWTGVPVDFTQEEETAADAASTQTPQTEVQNWRAARG
jgi:hypothetical protein